jgi:hypothetical protein
MKAYFDEIEEGADDPWRPCRRYLRDRLRVHDPE